MKGTVVLPALNLVVSLSIAAQKTESYADENLS